MAVNIEISHGILHGVPTHREKSPRYRLKTSDGQRKAIIVDVHRVLNVQNPNLERVNPHDKAKG